MRKALIAVNPDLVRDDPEWVVRIVGVEDERERLLEEFTDPERNSPVVATTSRLLSTGVDVEDLKYVVLLRPIGSMIEFKQIIGRGTRLYPDKDKQGFEIIDYVGATSLFEDPTFDGDPADIIVEEVDDTGEVIDSGSEPCGPVCGGDDSDELTVEEPEAPYTPSPPSPPPPPGRTKYYVDEGQFDAERDTALVAVRGAGGLRLTEYAQWAADQVRSVGTSDQIAIRWATTLSRKELLDALADVGVDVDEIVSAVREQTGHKDIDPLDALFHMAWNQPVRTRSERARNVRQRHFSELEAMTAQARTVFDGLLHRYVSHGIEELESPEVFRQEPLSELGTPVEIARSVGALHDQLDRVRRWLYESIA